MFQNITVAPEFRALVPTFLGAFIEAEVSNSPTSPQLWQEIEAEGRRLCATFTPETLKQQPGIAATRAAYKPAAKILRAIAPRPSNLRAVCCKAKISTA